MKMPKRYRDAETGEFTTKKNAEANPATTVSETVSRNEENFPQVRTADSREELAEKVFTRADQNLIPVTDVIEVKFSKLDESLKDGFLQIFSRLRDKS